MPIYLSAVFNNCKGICKGCCIENNLNVADSRVHFKSQEKTYKNCCSTKSYLLRCKKYFVPDKQEEEFDGLLKNGTLQISAFCCLPKSKQSQSFCFSL